MTTLALTRHFSLAMFLILPLGLIGVAVSSEPPAKQVVKGYLRVHAVPPKTLTGDDKKLDLAEFDFFKRNLVALIKSPLVIDDALEDKTVRDLPLLKQHESNRSEWLADQIEVKFPENAEVMTIGMVADDREQSRTIVNAVIAAVKNKIVEEERMHDLSRKLILEKKLRDYKQAQLDKQRQLYDLSQQIGSSDAQAAKIRYRMAVDSFRGLTQSRMDVRKQITDVTFKIELAKLVAKNSEKNTPANNDMQGLELRRELLTAQLKETTAELDAQTESVQKLERFNADADQLRSEIGQMQPVIRDMSNALTKLNIELEESPPRIEVIAPAR